MYYNIIAECSACILSFILIVTYYGASVPRNFKNRVFGLCLQAVFLCCIMNIISVVGIWKFKIIPDIIKYIITGSYFILLVLIPLLFSFYIASIVYERDTEFKKKLVVHTLPFLSIFVLVLTTPITKALFYFDVQGYHKGWLSYTTYAILIIYCLLAFYITFSNRERTSRMIQMLLYSFPMVSFLIMGVQFLFPKILLTGTAATISMLLIYLYLQNDLINYDKITGCPLQQSFLNDITNKLRTEAKFDIILLRLDDYKSNCENIAREKNELAFVVISKYLESVTSLKSIYRYQNNEFAILLHHKNEYSELQQLVETIDKRFKSTWSCGAFEYRFYSSIGVVRCPEQANSVRSIQELLEYAIIRAKEKENVFFCDEKTQHLVKRKREIIDILFEEMETGSKGFEVYYQPIYSVKEKKFKTAEALLRLNDTKIGPIYPSEFIPIAEETGLIIRIGELVFERVCDMIKILEVMHCEIEGISINFSALQMFRENIVEEVQALLKKRDVSPQKIRIEITESVFIDQYAEIKKVMSKLGDIGIQFYLDDFGTGYSSISNVIELPFEYIKFDKSLIWSSEASDKCYTLISQLSTAFSKHGMNILVEGVENIKQDELVKNINVDFIQGYYYARPVPAQEMVKYFMGQA